MSYLKIWIHIVFSTKNREPLMSLETKQIVCDHIRANCKEKDIYLTAIDGHVDHIHCLISLSKDQSVAKVVQLIKGESSFWINKNNITKTKFEWQDDYFAVSVSESQVEHVTAYINNQEEHHKKKTFTQEVNEFMQKYGWAYLN